MNYGYIILYSIFMHVNLRVYIFLRNKYKREDVAYMHTKHVHVPVLGLQYLSFSLQGQ